MKCLILLAIACAVAVSSSPVAGYGGVPSYYSGGSYLNRDYNHGTNREDAENYFNHGSSLFYDHGENHQKIKQVIEKEDFSKRNMGGGRQFTSSGGSIGRFDSYGREGLNAGGERSNYGPRIFK